MKKTLLSIFLTVLCAVLTISGTGCGNDEDNAWSGTWNIESVDGISFELADALVGIFGVTIERLLIFDNDGTWTAEITTKILRETETESATGDYAIDSSNYTMSGSGNIFLALKNSESLLTTGAFEDTGTWIRTGGNLTLTSADGTVLLLKR